MSGDTGPSVRRVLVVENEQAISLFLSDALVERGYGVAGPFASGKDAMAWLAVNTPNLAIVDLHLRDGFALELARDLRRRGIPFVFFSGDDSGTRIELDSEFRGTPWVAKPATLDQLLDALGQAHEA